MSLPKKNHLAIHPPCEHKLSDYVSVTSTYTSKVSNGPAMLTLVNAKKNGNRLELLSEFPEYLNATDTLQIVVNDEGIAFSNSLPGNEKRFGLRPYGRKKAIYSRNLVEELTARFELDFSNVTSISFQEAEFVTIDGEPAVFVPLRK